MKSTAARSESGDTRFAGGHPASAPRRAAASLSRYSPTKRGLERTGRFRIGGDQPVMDANGRSHISIEDAAVALIDEAELPRFVQRRFTIGY
jgi:hypothetical protein